MLRSASLVSCSLCTNCLAGHMRAHMYIRCAFQSTGEGAEPDALQQRSSHPVHLLAVPARPDVEVHVPSDVLILAPFQAACFLTSSAKAASASRVLMCASFSYGILCCALHAFYATARCRRMHSQWHGLCEARARRSSVTLEGAFVPSSSQTWCRLAFPSAALLPYAHLCHLPSPDALHVGMCMMHQRSRRALGHFT